MLFQQPPIQPASTDPTHTNNPQDGIFGEPDQFEGNFDFLWCEFATTDQPLPSSFFDTDLSLAEISQRYTNLGPPNWTGHEASEQIEPPAETAQQQTMASRLPSLEPGVGSPSSKEAHTEISASYRPLAEQHSVAVCPWRITAKYYEDLSCDLVAIREIIPVSFVFPTRHSLSRFLEGFFRGAHAHLPFLHAISFSVSAASLELVLSLAAAGAIHRFEHARGHELYQVAKTLVNWRLGNLQEKTCSTTPGYATFAGFQFTQVPFDDTENQTLLITSQEHKKNLQLLQSLLVLIDFTSWGDRASLQDALTMSSQAAMLVRQLGISTGESMNSDVLSWEEWIAQEERRRTLFASYVLFNLHCVAFNVPPLILNQEVEINLPASAIEWKSPNEEAWSNFRALNKPQHHSFSHVLDQLLIGEHIHHGAGISSFGNYVLIHGLFQQIFFERVATSCFANSTEPLRAEFVKTMESALRNWQESWETSRESTLDPSSPKGPLGFNSTALLRLAYIRLNANTGPHRELMTHDPVKIANAFVSSSISLCQRSAHLDRAVLQCIHALSVPVRVGIPFVARTQTLNWSVQHSLCNLECVILLVKWLLALAADVESFGTGSLRSDEYKLVNMLISLVRETEFAKSFDCARGDVTRLRQLALSTTRLWAETFRGFQVFKLVYTIGAGLSIVAEMLVDEE